MSKQLTYKQAVVLEHLVRTQWYLSQQAMADEVGTTQPTISRELKRAEREWLPYTADIRNKRVETRVVVNKMIHQRIVSDSKLEHYILEKIKKYWSPEQIAWTWKSETEETICHWTIYTYLYEYHPELIKEYLRRWGKKYRKTWASASKIPNRVSIHKRPAEVETKERIGDLEWDTIVGSNTGDRVVTSVDRKSKFLFADIILQQTDSSLSIATSVAMFKLLKDQWIHTLTLDNGVEFADHEYLYEMLGIKVYFADPYSSRQRGCNEYHNGLLRQFIPKWTDFKTITYDQLQYRVNLINNRPRKSLNYKTPSQVYYGAKTSKQQE